MTPVIAADGAPGAAGSAAAVPAAAEAGTIVLCAPGYPGNTVQAQPTMDRFSAHVERAAGWPSGSLRTVYHETEKGGIERLAEPASLMAIVPLPFLLQYQRTLGLQPRLQVETDAGADEVWSLVAKRGALSGPQSLAGWEVTGMPGYSPRFVSGLVLAKWGPLPADVRITFSAGVLGNMRRAASGERLAVILDREGAEALPGSPFGKDLEVVARSRALPASVVCTVGGRTDGARVVELLDALTRMHRDEAGNAVLRAMRIARFVPADTKAIEAARQAFKAAPNPAK